MYLFQVLLLPTQWINNPLYQVYTPRQAHNFALNGSLILPFDLESKVSRILINK